MTSLAPWQLLAIAIALPPLFVILAALGWQDSLPLPPHHDQRR